ncbi:MAG TPA: Smr/MutS family protein [Casimicrobiaceae bacterium]|nr:Smr/MutS family protein [Casimicrobiaceae bacterium]
MAKLGDLKALIEARRAAAAASRKPTPSLGKKVTAEAASRHAVSARKHAPEDVDLAQAFADVKRLPPRNRAQHRVASPPPIPRQSIADEREALLASKYGAEPALNGWEIGQEHEHAQTFVRSGLGVDVLTKLRRGHWSLQGEIDLHGFTSDEARDALDAFLLQARSRGARCVRVIHGKGLTSPGKEPVLKVKVRRWLSQWDDVLAYCEAPRHAGGGGAVLVLLRGS